MPIRIGFTERGDGGRDVDTWLPKVRNHEVDGAVIVTKTITAKLARTLLDLWQDGYHRLILHCTCTGWGGSYMEPGGFLPYDQIHALRTLSREGFPLRNAVLRIDPIIPSKEGIDRAIDVLHGAAFAGLFDDMADSPRLRFSILDSYPHVRARFAAAGVDTPYGDSFTAPPYMLQNAYGRLHACHDRLSSRHTMPAFETCAESYTGQYLSTHPDAPFKANVGCLSDNDLRIMGFSDEEINSVTGLNPQNRKGCCCLSCKTELLGRRHPCPNGCLYCYWK